jgi:hypothetical protein
VPQVVIENPILNSPFQEPTRHFECGEEGITNEIVEWKTQASLPGQDAVLLLFGLLRSGQVRLRALVGYQTWRR